MKSEMRSLESVLNTDMIPIALFTETQLKRMIDINEKIQMGAQTEIKQ